MILIDDWHVLIKSGLERDHGRMARCGIITCTLSFPHSAYNRDKLIDQSEASILTIDQSEPSPHSAYNRDKLGGRLLRKLLASSSPTRIQRSFHCRNRRVICRINGHNERSVMMTIILFITETCTTSNVTILRSIKCFFSKMNVPVMRQCHGRWQFLQA